MKQAFLSISYQHHNEFAAEIATVVEVMQSAGILTRVFVQDYHFTPDQHQIMMTAARAELERADLLIAEVTHKAIGVGIEIGFAWARGLPIIYLRRANAEPSTTVGGLAQHRIIYEDANDLRMQLQKLIVE